ALNPFSGGGVLTNDVTAAMFLLVRTQDMGTEVFTCPSDNASKDELEGFPAGNAVNFTGADNLSFGFADPYPANTAVSKGYKWNNNTGPEFAIAADQGPGDLDDSTPANSNSPASDQRKANSPNHDQDGQNVLFGDGHVEFATTAWVGQQKDNIYTQATEGDSANSQDNPAS